MRLSHCEDARDNDELVNRLSAETIKRSIAGCGNLVKILSLYKRALIAYNYDHVNGDFSAVVRGSFIRSGLRVELSVLFWLIAEFRRIFIVPADVPRKRASWNKGRDNE